MFPPRHLRRSASAPHWHRPDSAGLGQPALPTGGRGFAASGRRLSSPERDGARSPSGRPHGREASLFQSRVGYFLHDPESPGDGESHAGSVRGLQHSFNLGRSDGHDGNPPRVLQRRGPNGRSPVIGAGKCGVFGAQFSRAEDGYPARSGWRPARAERSRLSEDRVGPRTGRGDLLAYLGSMVGPARFSPRLDARSVRGSCNASGRARCR